MFREESRDAGAARRQRHLVQWSIPFTQRYNVFFRRGRGQKLAKSPYSAAVQYGIRAAAFSPGGFQRVAVEAACLPGRIGDLKQVPTCRATEILGRRRRSRSAPDAAKIERGLRQRRSRASFGGGRSRHGIEGYFVPRRYWSVLLIQSARGGLNTSRSTVSSSASALCGICAGMHSTSPECTTISWPPIQNFNAPSRM